jgi:chemotaxis response regulator CheB
MIKRSIIVIGASAGGVDAVFAYQECLDGAALSAPGAHVG